MVLLRCVGFERARNGSVVELPESWIPGSDFQPALAVLYPATTHSEATIERIWILNIEFSAEVDVEEKDVESAEEMNPLLCDRCNNYFIPNPELHRYPKDLSGILRLNVPPSDTDASKTAIFLRDVESELRRYNEELSRLRLLSQQLEIQRKELLKKAVQHRSWLSPIRKLPVEILQTIFLHVCPTNSSHSLVIDSDKAFRDAPAYKLSCVSFHWKTVASGLPRLWSSLKADIFELDTDPRSLLQLYLDNSRNQPLNLEISCHKYGIALGDNRSLKDRLGKYGFRILKMLFEHIHRCEILSLDIEGEESELIEMVGAGGSVLSMPNLHTLTTRLDDNYRAGHSFWESVRDNSPNLKIVRSGKLLGIDLIRYENLTALVVDWAYDAFTNQIFRVIERCINIRSLSMHEVLVDEDPGLGKPVILGALEQLTITFAEASYHIYTLFNNITVPSLKSLNISGGETAFSAQNGPGVPGVWSPASLVAMFQRSGCAVQELVLQIPDNILESEFCEVLESCPTLTCLTVSLRRGMQGRETFAYRLLHRLQHGVLGQHLEQLSINEKDAQFDFQDVLDILDVVESRNRVSESRSTVLQTVRIEFGRLAGNTGLESTLEERRRKLEREGIHVAIVPTFPSDDVLTVLSQSWDDI
ncbi:hypothetical protein VNI00_015711 [Paramarasmius palmivorus]|uniref:F-box domain-containing protein n=1 Tax=Paramarasmius palmivorus TaxID=297713 RepID=A0AAW0BJI1_9AGAR